MDQVLKCFCSLFFIINIGCVNSINPKNKILILAKRSDAAVAARNNRSSMKYYWEGKLLRDTNPFDARYSRKYDYFLIYIDKTNPKKWMSYSREDYGYSDTSYIPDSIRQQIYFDNADFNLLEQEH